jgi:hypothetical protein
LRKRRGGCEKLGEVGFLEVRIVHLYLKVEGRGAWVLLIHFLLLVYFLNVLFLLKTIERARGHDVFFTLKKKRS